MRDRPRAPSARWTLGVTLMATVVACTGYRPPAGPQPRTPVPTAFNVTSFRSAYGIDVRFAGTADVAGEWMQVIIRSGAVRAYQQDPTQYRNLRIRAAVATCTAGGHWALASESLPVRVTAALASEDAGSGLDAGTHELRDTLRLNAALPPGTRLDRAWMAIVVEWPVSNSFASYELHADFPLAVAAGTQPPDRRWTDRSGGMDIGTRCR